MNTRMQRLGLKMAIVVCGAGLVVASAAAQDAPPPPSGGQQQGPPPGGRPGMDPGERAARVQKQLGLTDDVTGQVKAIYADSMTKMQAMRANGGSREDMMAARTAETAKVKALLTPDQQTKYDEMQVRRGPGGGPGGPPSGGGGPPPQQ